MSDDTRDLFDGLPVDFSARIPSLKEARRLLGAVEALAYSIDTFWEDVDRAETLARKLDAHSVARALDWMKRPEVFDGYGYDAVHSQVEGVARRWLRRQEVDS